MERRRRPTSVQTRAATAALCALALAYPAGAQATRAGAFLNYDFSRQPITKEAIARLDNVELSKLRALVFARHGRVFKAGPLQDYVASQLWYRPNPDFTNALLNDVERQSLDVIREAEAAASPYLHVGDMRFYRNSPIRADQFDVTYSPTDLRILEAEIEAEHGKRFDDEPWLQAYFEERYWYRPNPAYSEALLSPTELHNLEVIRGRRRTVRATRLAPGSMSEYQRQRIPEGLLRGLTLRALRILRNEVFALRGRPFKTPWLAERFYGSGLGYTENPSFKESDLSEIERENIRTILRVEERIRHDLATAPVDTAMLAGLDLAELRLLRNEIYARRGRVFRDKRLQGYFASLPWYKPEPGFREERLTAIEKQNALAILAYEAQRLEEMTQVEG